MKGAYRLLKFDIWIPSMMLYNDSLGKNRCLADCHFQGNMKETGYKCWFFFFSLWQMKYIHNAYSLSKNGIWNGLDLNSLKRYIKLNMVSGLKFLRLYIFFFYRDEYCTYSSETVPMESWKVSYEAVNTTHL